MAVRSVGRGRYVTFNLWKNKYAVPLDVIYTGRISCPLWWRIFMINDSSSHSCSSVREMKCTRKEHHYLRLFLFSFSFSDAALFPVNCLGYGDKVSQARTIYTASAVFWECYIWEKTTMGCTASKLGGENTSRESLSYDHTPWKLLHTASLSRWTEIQQMLGFPDVDFSAKKSRLQPWCMGGGHLDALLPAPVDGTGLDVAYTYAELLVLSESPRISYRLKLRQNYKSRLFRKKTPSGLKNAQVIAYRDFFAVIQIVQSDKSELLFLDMDADEVCGRHVEYFGDQPFLFECYISPDRTTFLLKPNLLFSLKYGVQHVPDVLKVLRPSTGKPESSCQVIQELFRDAAAELILCFDPRYRHTRVAVANVTRRGQPRALLLLLEKTQNAQEIVWPSIPKGAKSDIQSRWWVLGRAAGGLLCGANHVPSEVQLPGHHGLRLVESAAASQAAELRDTGCCIFGAWGSVPHVFISRRPASNGKWYGILRQSGGRLPTATCLESAPPVSS